MVAVTTAGILQFHTVTLLCVCHIHARKTFNLEFFFSNDRHVVDLKLLEALNNLGYEYIHNP